MSLPFHLHYVVFDIVTNTINAILFVILMLLVSIFTNGFLFVPGFTWQVQSASAFNSLVSIPLRQPMVRDLSTTFPLSITGKEISQVKVAVAIPQGVWIDNAFN